jgi:beta-glucosidase/6-phospho-beta-glucosidase/beta-galactosidase
MNQIRAARDTGTQVIWDLCHYGVPDDVDIFDSEFIARFAAFARAFARLLANETDDMPFVAPVNEISFFTWAAGEVAYLHPFVVGRGDELKRQLVRGAIEATEAMWSVDARTRIVHTDPIIHIVASPDRPQNAKAAECYRTAQFQSWDMLAGRLTPELGGAPKYLDIIGVNYYPNNQWVCGADSFNPEFALPRSHPDYRALRFILDETYRRYRRPLLIAETGAEGDARPEWLAYIGAEVRRALEMGVEVEGICLYPIVNHPGWDDDRHCHNGLWDYADEYGERLIYEPLAAELSRQQSLFADKHDKQAEPQLSRAQVA